MKAAIWLLAGIFALPVVAQPPTATPAAKPLPKPAPIEHELRFVVNVQAQQNWKKNDPEYPGEQWSKATTTQRYELATHLKSDGVLEVRNLLDPDLDTRLEAKTIHLARAAKKSIEASGKPFKPPKTEADLQALNRQMQADRFNCKGNAACTKDSTMHYAAIIAAMQYPDALKPDTEAGRYQYFLPFKGCAESSRITLTMQIEGVRYNKTSDKFVPFSERRHADTVNASDGLALCEHFLVVMDTSDQAEPMRVENVFVPRPEGITEYTESGHTSRTPEPQPMPGAVLEWMTETLRHAPASGKASTVLPLSLSLNGNSTWLGLWKGSARVNFAWSFTTVAHATKPGVAGVTPKSANGSKPDAAKTAH